MADENQNQRCWHITSQIQVTTSMKRLKRLKIFRDTGAQEYALQVRDAYNDLAKSHVISLPVSEQQKDELIQFADFMAARKM